MSDPGVQCTRCYQTGHRASRCPKRWVSLWPGLILTSTLALAGCAEMGQVQQSLAIVDTFCSNKKRTWSVNDSPESIRQAEAWNSAIDKRCGVKS